MHLQFLTLSVAIDVAAAAAFAGKLGAPDDTPWDVHSVTFTPETDTAEHAANFATISFLASDGATVLAKHSTDSAAEGSLSDGVPVALDLGGKGSPIYGASHQKIAANTAPSAYRVTVAHGGTGAAVKGRLLVVLKRQPRTEPVEA